MEREMAKIKYDTNTTEYRQFDMGAGKWGFRAPSIGAEHAGGIPDGERPFTGTSDPLGGNMGYSEWRNEGGRAVGYTMVRDDSLQKLMEEAEMAQKTKAELEKRMAELEAANDELRASKHNHDCVPAIKHAEVVAERDSACVAFSEALVQAAKAEAELKKKHPTSIAYFKLANASLELANYAKAIEDAGSGSPGTAILKVEKLLKSMV